jgi:hypothetical protein
VHWHTRPGPGCGPGQVRLNMDPTGSRLVENSNKNPPTGGARTGAPSWLTLETEIVQRVTPTVTPRSALGGKVLSYETKTCRHGLSATRQAVRIRRPTV